MDNLVGVFVGVLVIVIILYNVTLPTMNTAVYGSGAAANLSAQNLTLTGTIQTLLVTTVIVYVVRAMLG